MGNFYPFSIPLGREDFFQLKVIDDPHSHEDLESEDSFSFFMIRLVLLLYDPTEHDPSFVTSSVLAA